MVGTIDQSRGFKTLWSSSEEKRIFVYKRSIRRREIISTAQILQYGDERYFFNSPRLHHGDGQSFHRAPRIKYGERNYSSVIQKLLYETVICSPRRKEWNTEVGIHFIILNGWNSESGSISSLCKGLNTETWLIFSLRNGTKCWYEIYLTHHRYRTATKRRP